jgi:hypothetical protein
MKLTAARISDTKILSSMQARIKLSLKAQPP